MLHGVAVWLLVVAFCGAGLFNAVGTRATQNDFARWGYPRWWCRVTGALEIASAVRIAFSPVREWGLVLAAAIIVVAILTVARRREFSHAPPLGGFVLLLVLAAVI